MKPKKIATEKSEAKKLLKIEEYTHKLGGGKTKVFEK